MGNWPLYCSMTYSSVMQCWLRKLAHVLWLYANHVFHSRTGELKASAPGPNLTCFLCRTCQKNPSPPMAAHDRLLQVPGEGSGLSHYPNARGTTCQGRCPSRRNTRSLRSWGMGGKREVAELAARSGQSATCALRCDCAAHFVDASARSAERHVRTGRGGGANATFPITSR